MSAASATPTTMTTTTTLMELLHDKSLPTIGLLQDSFTNGTDFMISISTLFDPRYVFLIYAPILFAFNKRVGQRMIIALTWAEWANQCLKWLLAGERPYWYVHERAIELASVTSSYNNQTTSNNEHLSALADSLPSLKQFPVTCELGAGSPSGHAMVTATVWYILIDAFLKNELKLFERAQYTTTTSSSNGAKKEEQSSSSLAKFFWTAYMFMLILVSLSRVYLACHFPHQCATGALLGCCMAYLVAEKLPMHALSRRHFVGSTLFMLSTALATYAVLKLYGFNPLWSVDKAMRWCVKSEYIHLDTTPFFSMMRYLGFCLGSGLAYDGLKLAERTSEQQPFEATTSGSGVVLLARRLVVCVCAILFGQLLLGLPMPKSNLNLFYVISFFIYTLFAYAISGPIPDAIKWALPARVHLVRLQGGSPSTTTTTTKKVN